MCEFVIQGEPQREMASAIISSKEPVGRHSNINTRVHFFIKTERRHKTKIPGKRNGISELMGQGVDVQFISHMHQPEPQPKAGKRSS